MDQNFSVASEGLIHTHSQLTKVDACDFSEKILGILIRTKLRIHINRNTDISYYLI